MTRPLRNTNRRILETNNHHLSVRSSELEEVNRNHRIEERRLMAIINRMTDAVRELCIKILSGNVRNEPDAASWENMDILILIGKASTSLDSQQQRWVDLADDMMKKMKRILEENETLHDELDKNSK